MEAQSALAEVLCQYRQGNAEESQEGPPCAHQGGQSYQERSTKCWCWCGAAGLLTPASVHVCVHYCECGLYTNFGKMPVVTRVPVLPLDPRGSARPVVGLMAALLAAGQPWSPERWEGEKGQEKEPSSRPAAGQTGGCTDEQEDTAECSF